MKFGAHEVLECADILREKMNLINHFALYEQEAQNRDLRQMIRHHMETAIADYDMMVGYTHDYSASLGMQPPFPQPDPNIESLKYGLRNPPSIAPQPTGRFNDLMIMNAMLVLHKASAVCHIQRGLEVSDPNLRRMFLNGGITCYNQAYEVFLIMNEQETYQVPSMDNHTAKTYLHSFQPLNQQRGMEMGMNAGMSSDSNMGTGYGTGSH